MRTASKVLIIAVIVAIGAGAWYIGSRDSSPPAEPVVEQTTPPTPLADTATLDVTPDENQLVSRATPSSSADVSSGAVASPPTVEVRPDEARSFRPPAIGVTERETAAAEPVLPMREHEPVADSMAPLNPPTPLITGNAEPSEPAVTSSLPEPEAINAALSAATPPPASKPAAETPAPKLTEHVIQPGDTYSSLAVKYLGSERYTALIAKANPGKDPRRLFVGKVKIPALPETASRVAEGDRTPAGVRTAGPSTQPAARPAPTAQSAPPIPEGRAYKVQPGEGWYDLAKKFLGDGNRWPELFELNKERVSNNPYSLRAGAMIEVPKQAATRPS